MTTTTTKSAKENISQRKVSDLKDWRLLFLGVLPLVREEGGTQTTITNDFKQLLVGRRQQSRMILNNC
jgi:hypothetical protein